MQTRRLIKAQELADRHQVSLRTIYRDIRTLEQSGVPIIGEAGMGYSLEKSFHLPPIHLSPEECNTLLFASKLLQPFTDQSVRDQYASALDKIRAVLHVTQNDDLDTLNQQVKIVDHGISPVDNSNNISRLQTALLEGKLIEISYFAQYNSTQTSRKIAPIGLTFYANTWHLIAWCYLREEYRDFRTDRIKEINTLNINYKKTDYIGLDEYIDKLSKRNEVHRVELKIDKDFYPFINNQKYSLGYVSEIEKEDCFIVEFLTGSLDYTAQYLLMWGKYAHIISPPTLVDKVKMLLSDLNDQYL